MEDQFASPQRNGLGASMGLWNIERARRNVLEDGIEVVEFGCNVLCGRLGAKLTS